MSHYVTDKLEFVTLLGLCEQLRVSKNADLTLLFEKRPQIQVFFQKPSCLFSVFLEHFSLTAVSAFFALFRRKKTEIFANLGVI